MRDIVTKAGKFLRQLRTSGSIGKRRTILQTIDIITLGLHYGFSPLEYYLYGFDRDSITRKEKLSYISNEKINRVFRPLLNSRKWVPILSNKLLFFLFFSKLELPVAKVYGFYYPRRGFFFDGSQLEGIEDFIRWQNKSRIKNMVVKPVSSLAGKGIKILDKLISPENIKCNDGNTYSLEDIFSFMDSDIKVRQPEEDPYSGYIIEEKVEQDTQMNLLGGPSLNTVRISTLRRQNGEVLIDFGMLRVGGEGSLTDNLHQGGYVVNIDVSDGSLAEKTYGYKGKYGPWIEEKEINIKAHIKDGKVPYWKHIVSLASKAASFLPGVCSVGWDVAISDKGPILMEGNSNWDMVIAQVLSGGYLTEERREILKGYGLEFPV
jgi:hypothetical protein